MILGMSTASFTLLHVVISLIGIASGLVVLVGLLKNQRRDGWTVLFLASTTLTSLTGFAFPVPHLLPSHVIGGISLVVLALAVLARYRFKLAHGWRRTYVIAAMLALYLNSFVAVVQSFLKVPVLKAMAPTQTELPFVVAQSALLAVFVWLTVLAVKKFRELTPVRQAAAA